MPNWCSNNMTIIGPEDQVRSIVNAVRPVDGEDRELGLTTFMPQPRDENGDPIEGTSWQYENWGTKWGDSDTELTYEEYSGATSSASVTYNTPWGPMSRLVAEISRQHPDCVIDVEYEEPGMCFFGLEQFRAGELIYERHHEYDFDAGVIKLPDGWEMNFDTDWDNEDQDPSGTLNDAIYAALEHLWVGQSLAGDLAPSD
jgi:hypothetical protein